MTVAYFLGEPAAICQSIFDIYRFLLHATGSSLNFAFFSEIRFPTLHMAAENLYTNGLFTLHENGNGKGKGVSILCYVLYTLHSDRDRDKEPLFSVPVPVPCSMYEPLGTVK